MKEDIALSQQRHLLLSEELYQMRWWEHISFPRSQLAIMCLGVASAQQLSPFRASHTLRKSNDSQHPTLALTCLWKWSQPQVHQWDALLRQRARPFLQLSLNITL